VLKDWFWKDDTRAVSALNVWQQTCQQLYLPRILNDTAFQNTMAAGADSRDFFGFAQGTDAGSYLGFSFGQRTSLFMDASLLLIEPAAAAAHQHALAEAQRVDAAAVQTPATGVTPISTGTGTVLLHVNAPTQVSQTAAGVAAPQPLKNQFYASIELDPILAKKQFADLVDEVVLQFTARPGVKVMIAIEIQAESASGFDDNLQRAVRENCKVLRFKTAEFENQR
jgi:hypothetical protein